MKSKKALLIVDIQNDFCPGGALGVREGDQIIPTVNEYVNLFIKKSLPVFVSRDWHPKDTRHFKGSGGPWPVHCVQNTRGAEFHRDFRIPKEAIILSKGSDSEMDGYSVFEAHDSKKTPFLDLLKKMGIEELYIAGIATDYCVRMTSLDAFKKGLKVNVLSDAIKGVDEKDSKRAIDEIITQNGKLKIFSEVTKELIE